MTTTQYTTELQLRIQIQRGKRFNESQVICLDWDDGVVWKEYFYTSIQRYGVSRNGLVLALLLYDSNYRKQSKLHSQVLVLRVISGEAIDRVVSGELKNTEVDGINLEEIANSYEQGKGWPAKYPLAKVDNCFRLNDLGVYIQIDRTKQDKNRVTCRDLSGKLIWEKSTGHSPVSIELEPEKRIVGLRYSGQEFVNRFYIANGLLVIE